MNTESAHLMIGRASPVTTARLQRWPVGLLVVGLLLIGLPIPLVGQFTSTAEALDYRGTILADNPVSYWRLGQATNTETLVDEKGVNQTSFTGGEVGGVAGSGAILGDSDTSTYFPGGQYAIMGTSPSLKVSPFTMEAWFKAPPTSVGNKVILSNQVAGGGGSNLYLADGKPTAVSAFGSAPFSLVVAQARTAFNNDQWHHIALTHDAVALRIYVDGGLVAQQAMSPATTYKSSPTTYTGIAWDTGPQSNTFVGDLDEVAIYGQALSQAQLQTHYTTAGYTLGPVGGEIGPLEGLGPCDKGSPATSGAHANSGDPVNTATGNFWEAFDDLSVPGRGLPLHLTHTYNSLMAATDGPMGYGWTDSYAMSLSDDTHVVTVRQENGCQLTYTKVGAGYSAPPRVTATLIRSGSNYVLTRSGRETDTFDSAGKLTLLTDLNGYATTLGYNGSGQLTTVTEPAVTGAATRTLTFAYLGSRVSSVTDTASPARVVRFAYDGAGNLTDYTDATTGVTHMTYDSSHQMLTLLDPNQAASPTPVPVTNHYDGAGRVDWQKDQLARQTTFDYTTTPGSTKVTDPKGNVVVYRYSYGTLVSVTRAPGLAEQAIWNYAYEPATLGLALITDANNHNTTMTYDDRGNLLSRTDPLNRTTSFTYDTLNDMTSATDAKGITTTYVFDVKGNPQSSSTPHPEASDSQVTSFGYDPAHAGDVLTMTDPMTKGWSYTYDPYGDLASVTDPVTPTHGTTTLCYDGVGRRTASISPKGVATSVTCASTRPAAFTTYYATNALGQVTAVTDPLGHGTTHAFDLNHNPTTTTDADLNSTTNVYNLANEVVTVNRPDGTHLNSDYFADGSVNHTYDGANQPTTYAYDPQGRLSTATDPDTRMTTYGYDAGGDRISVQQPGGNCAAAPKVACITYGFNAVDQPTSVTYSDGAGPNVSAIGYDLNGQRTSMTDSSGTSTWAWDSLHRLTLSTNGAGKAVGYGYDLANRQTSITYPDTTGTVTRVPDEAGRVKSVTDWAPRTTSFAYDADGFMTSKGFPTTGTVDTFTPDGADRLMGVTAKTGTTTLGSFSYGRDNANQVSSVTSIGVPADNHGYSYSQLNQLKTDNGAPFGYDAADNLTRTAKGTAQSFDPANQLTSTTGAPPTTAYGFVGDLPAPADFDGDGKVDLAVFRPSVGAWYIHPSGGGSDMTANLGLSGDIPVPADFDGDSKADEAVFRPSSGAWYIHPSGGGSDTTVYFGLSGYKPLPADFDGDGKADVAVFSPSGGWYIHPSGGGSDVTVYFGLTNDIPVVGDYNGDGKADEAVFRPSVGGWYIHPSGGGSDTTVYFGLSSDAPVAADYDGDHKTDEAVFRPSTGIWYVHPSGGGADTSTSYGLSTDTLLPRDYDGDSRADLAFFRPTTATWSLRATSATAYAYDNRGNRISRTPLDAAPMTYAYDQANRMIAAPGATYAYDGDGLRRSKTITATGVTTSFVWDVSGGIPLLLSESTPTLTTNYVYGPGGLPIEQVDSSGTVLYYHHDQLGSTRLLTAADGSVAGAFSYDAFGKPTGSTGTATTRLGFAGQYTDTETGFSYLRARYYDPATGQFLNRDPITALTHEPYGYAGGNPLNVVDPSGLDGGPPASTEVLRSNHTTPSDWSTSLCEHYMAAGTSGNPAAAIYFRFSAEDLTTLRGLVSKGYLPDYGLTWSTDSCSTAGGKAADGTQFGLFGDACGRHDFGYRNHKAIFGRTAESDRSVIDGGLRDDASDACSSVRGLVTNFGFLGRCITTAGIVYGAVRAFGSTAYS